MALVNIGGGASGGSVIAPEWVLTAAHCVKNSSTIGVRSLVSQQTGQVTLHPLWNGYVTDGHDLALVRVSTSLTAGIAPIQVGAPFNPGSYAAGTPAKIMGTDRTSASPGSNAGFQAADTVLHSDDYMDDIYNPSFGYDHWIESLMIGAGDKRNSSMPWGQRQPAGRGPQRRSTGTGRGF